MIPFLETGVTLASTKGVDFLRKHRVVKTDLGAPTARDNAIDAALSALAIGPQLVNVLGESPLMDRVYPLPLPVLYRLYKARPYLEMVSMLALGALTYRERTAQSNSQWLNRSLKAVGALRFGAQILSAPTAFSAEESGHLVVTARELDRLLEPDDRVLGLVLNGEARCYPLEVMRKPHFLHDTVGGVPVVPTYCPTSNTALAFRDDWQGARLDFNVAGAPNGNVVFYEGHSDGLVQQLEAAIGAGPHTGDPLQVFPLANTTWRHWRALHPETTGLWYDKGPKAGAVTAMLKGLEHYDASNPEPLFRVRGGVDGRLAAKDEVLAVKYKGQARAYPRALLSVRPVINTELAGEPVVVLYDEARDMAACFSRRADGRVLTFEEARHEKGVAADRETGRVWDVTGCARDRDGTCLAPVAFTVDKVYWYAWAHFYPQTAIAGEPAPEPVRP